MERRLLYIRSLCDSDRDSAHLRIPIALILVSFVCGDDADFSCATTLSSVSESSLSLRCGDREPADFLTFAIPLCPLTN